jgi:hypothetical protein
MRDWARFKVKTNQQLGPVELEYCISPHFIPSSSPVAFGRLNDLQKSDQAMERQREEQEKEARERARKEGEELKERERQAREVREVKQTAKERDEQVKGTSGEVVGDWKFGLEARLFNAPPAVLELKAWTGTILASAPIVELTSSTLKQLQEGAIVRSNNERELKKLREERQYGATAHSSSKQYRDEEDNEEKAGGGGSRDIDSAPSVSSSWEMEKEVVLLSSSASLPVASRSSLLSRIPSPTSASPLIRQTQHSVSFHLH